MMEDKNYFGVTSDKATEVRADGQVIWTDPSMIPILFIGMIYDFVGRRSMITLYLLLMSVTIALLPYTAPSSGGYVGTSTLSVLLFNYVAANPLILDYVAKES